MKKVLIILLILLILLILGVVVYFIFFRTTESSAINLVYTQIPDLELPCDDTRIIRHTGYSFSYNEQHEVANWVAYQLTKSELNSKAKRSDRFKPDNMVVTGTAENKDYLRSGYDKGHLAPAADMAFSDETMSESFYFSNITPQVPEFNRGIWKELEEQTRKWAQYFDSIYIVTGPVLYDSLPKIGKNEVSVPEYFFKAVLCYNKYTKVAIGFIIPNQKIETSFYNYVVSIDEIESKTGLDLFCKLPDNIEPEIEKNNDVNYWLSRK